MTPTFPHIYLESVIKKRVNINCRGISYHAILQATADEDSISNPPREGAYVKRLFLEGASWNVENSCLKEPETMQFLCQMPIIHLKPCSRKRQPSEPAYLCPVYLYPCRRGTPERPSIVTMQELKPGGQDPSFWVKRGTAILLSTST